MGVWYCLMPASDGYAASQALKGRNIIAWGSPQVHGTLWIQPYKGGANSWYARFDSYLQPQDRKTSPKPLNPASQLSFPKRFIPNKMLESTMSGQANHTGFQVDILMAF
jgi:hypothetical protein